MTADVRVLTPRPADIQADVIAKLQEVLEAAQRGQIVAVAIATVNSNRSVGSAYSKSDHCWSLVGAIAELQHRLLVDREND